MLFASPGRIAHPTVVGLNEDYALLTWIQGTPGSKSVVSRVFNLKTTKPAGDTLRISSVQQDESKAAGVQLKHGGMVAYGARQGLRHQLWSSFVECK